jgi:hypothetical protein
VKLATNDGVALPRHVFHYIVEDQLTYLCMADDDLKRRVSFLFLEDMKKQFRAMYGARGHTAIAFAMNDEFQHVIRRQMVFEVYGKLAA